MVLATQNAFGQHFMVIKAASQLTQQENSGEVFRLACLSVAPPLKLCPLEVIEFFIFLYLLPHLQTQEI